MKVDLEQNSKRTFRVAIAWISTALLLIGSSPAAWAGSSDSGTSSDSPLMEEVISTSDTEPRGWEWLYSAYSCVYHQNDLMASRWLMYALRQGAGDLILKSRTDLAYLSKGPAMGIWVHRGNFVVVANEPVPESAKDLPLFKNFQRWGKPPINPNWSIVDIEQNISIEEFDTEDLPAKYRDLPKKGIYGHELDFVEYIQRGLKNRDMTPARLKDIEQNPEVIS